jgi:hypothetical protein
MIHFALVLASTSAPMRNLEPRKVIPFRAEYRDHSGTSEMVITYDLEFRVLSKRDEKKGWPCRLNFSNQTTTIESHKFSQRGLCGTLDLSIGEQGMAGPLSFRASDAVTSLPRLAFFIPDAPQANGDYTYQPSANEGEGWTISGKLTTSSVRRDVKVVGDVKAKVGDARLHFETIIDERGLPISATISRRGEGQDAEFTLHRR